MLAPDVATTQTALTGVQGAIKDIDQYVVSIQAGHFAPLTIAETILMTHKAVTDYGAIKASVETAQAHAKQWTESLSPALRAAIFQGTHDFASTFQTKSQRILSLLSKPGDGEIPSILQELLSKLTSQRLLIDEQKKKLAAFGGQMTADSNSITSDGALIQTAIADVREWQAKMDRFATNPRDRTRERQMRATNAKIADELAGALSQLAEKFSSWESLSGAAHTAIDNLATIWEGLEGHYQEVIKNLPAGKTPDIVFKGEIIAAQKAWQSLTDFVSDETAASAN